MVVALWSLPQLVGNGGGNVVGNGARGTVFGDLPDLITLLTLITPSFAWVWLMTRIPLWSRNKCLMLAAQSKWLTTSGLLLFVIDIEGLAWN
jgi:hypothetical protein